MPHIAKLDRKGLLIALAIGVIGLCCWFLPGDKPRTVAESEWENIVFPEMSNRTVTDFARESLPMPEKTVPVVPEPAPSEPRGLRVEMVANAPLDLGHDREARNQEAPVREFSRGTEPIRLEGGIEPADATGN